MLDLVVEAAEREVRQPAAPDVARHEDLPTQEVDLLVRRDDGHPGVVGSERSPEKQAEQAHLDAEERSGLARGQHHEQCREVAADSRDDECRLAPPVLERLSSQDRLNARTCRASPRLTPSPATSLCAGCAPSSGRFRPESSRTTLNLPRCWQTSRLTSSSSSASGRFSPVSGPAVTRMTIRAATR